jgi:hypothetical protein
MIRQLPIIPLVPRGTNQCLDLAVRYFGQFLPVLLGMWVLVALPSASAVYALAVREKIDIRLALLVIYFSTLPLGVLLMNDAVPRIFGRSLETGLRDTPQSRRGMFVVSAVLVGVGLFWAFLAENLGDRLGLSVGARSWSIALGLGLAAFVVLLNSLVSVARHQQIDWGTARVFFLCLFLRSLCIVGPALALFPPFGDWRLALVLLFTILPGLWLAIRSGFLLERTCLARLDRHLHAGHVSDLVKEESGELFGRAWWMAQFGLLVWGVLFVTADACASLFFRAPIFLGRLQDLPPGSEAKDYFQHAWELLLHDPLILATLTATALLVYPINRLAWFFCYIDLRVRKDCWDLEIRISNETHHIAEALAQAQTET